MNTTHRSRPRRAVGPLGLAGACLAAVVASAALAQQPRTGSDDASRNRTTDSSRAGTTAQGGTAQGGGSFWLRPEGSLTFGRTPLHLKRKDSVTLHNDAGAALRLRNVTLEGANKDAFTLENGCRDQVAAGQECRIDISFEPTAEGDRTAELRVVTADGATRTRTVTGTGVAAKYEAKPKSIAFGTVGRNAASREQVVTITNTGDVNLPITATSLSGPNEQQFYQSNDCPRELEVGKSCRSTITYRPTFQGRHAATLTVWAKGGAPETRIELSGTGSG